MSQLRRHARSTAVVATLATGGVVLTATAAAAYPTNAYQGPSSSATPYVIPNDPSDPGTQVQSLVSTPDKVPLAGGPAGARYQFNGTPDGIAAFDNGDGTYTTLVNHEFVSGAGAVRAHGSRGSYVSRLVIRKSDNSVISGEDLIKQVFLGDPTTSTTPAAADAAAFNRFCSADLPAVSAFYNAASGKGSQARIFMNGEESTGRAFGNVAAGTDTGKTYELPALGKFSWENSVANPGTGDKTVVVGDDDSGPTPGGEIYVYIGDKKSSGSTEVQKAGLTGGSLYGIAVQTVGGTGTLAQEDRANGLGTTPNQFSSTFTLFNTGDATAKTATQLQTASDNTVTKFLRPEDFTWDADNPSIGYFQTTDRYDGVKDGQVATSTNVGRSRLWKIAFSDINNLPAGGTITALLDGTESINMLDNLASSKGGKLILLEDVGNNPHNGKVWQYDVASDSLKLLLQHDPDRFGDLNKPATTPFNQDEETSGVVDVSALYGAPALSGAYYLFDDQAHYAITGEAVEGGQLMLLHLGTDVPSQFTTGPAAAMPEVPLAAGLPLAALVLGGGAYLLKRRRDGRVEMA